MTKIGYLGVGAWGFCLSSLLATKKKYKLTCWTNKEELAKRLNETRQHPLFPNLFIKGDVSFTTDLGKTVRDADIIIESVSSAGIRPVFEKVKTFGISPRYIIVTSKGIEQNSGKILPQVVAEILGEPFKPYIGFLSGPGFADEVIRGMPTSVVGTGFSTQAIKTVCDIFKTENFRIYPNADIFGVAIGGAMKNIIAIACGICQGLSLGSSSKAALMTRGLHEIRKLAVACGCESSTINGLAGMGDLCLTCSSLMSRNFRFGSLLAQGVSSSDAQKQIGMVVEGAYACVSALQLGKQHKIDLPITEAVYQIIYENLKPSDAVLSLMKRAIKEEHL